jgi:hypothetical protein
MCSYNTSDYAEMCQDSYLREGPPYLDWCDEYRSVGVQELVASVRTAHSAPVRIIITAARNEL